MKKLSIIGIVVAAMSATMLFAVFGKSDSATFGTSANGGSPNELEAASEDDGGRVAWSASGSDYDANLQVLSTSPVATYRLEGSELGPSSSTVEVRGTFGNAIQIVSEETYTLQQGESAGFSIDLTSLEWLDNATIETPLILKVRSRFSLPETPSRRNSITEARYLFQNESGAYEILDASSFWPRYLDATAQDETDLRRTEVAGIEDGEYTYVSLVRGLDQARYMEITGVREHVDETGDDYNDAE